MIQHRVKFRWVPLLLLLGLMVVLVELGSSRAGTAAAAPTADPNWIDPIAITTAATTPNGAIQPVVSSSSDGKTVMVAFNWHRSAAEGDRDPYYSRSTDNGETWSAPAPIFESVATSHHVYIDYAANGIAHAVWQENKGLFYANEGTANGDAWPVSPKQIVAPGSNPGVTNPSIFASSSNRLDIVWSEGNNGLPNPEPNIYHARSKDGGVTWPINAIVQDTGGKSQFPDMGVDANGIVHLVWQDNDDLLDPSRGTIWYTQGTESGGNMTWSPRINLTPYNPVPGVVEDDAREPKIEIIGNTLHVVYTDVSLTDAKGEQFVYHVQCAAQCTNAANWHLPAEQISGQKVGANGANPLNVVATISGLGNCAHVYFHGIHPDFSNEAIFGINSCNNWSDGLSNQMTFDDTVQSINPSLDVQNDWWLYLTYEQDDATNQIYFHRDSSEIYLPVMFKE